jgi:YYY domain-containing protein
MWWLLGLTQLVPNNPWVVWGVLGAASVASGFLLKRNWRDFFAFVRRDAWTIVVMEILTIVFFLSWALIRAYMPEINHTEQPMDLAFLNSTIRSSSFPPSDPWLSGFNVSYYYFGYLIMGALTLMSGVLGSIGYNLALCTIPALLAVSVFGLVYNLVRLSKGSADAGTAAGLISVVLVMSGHLGGVLEFMWASGIGSVGLWEWVGIDGMTGSPAATSRWYPAEMWWWFRTTRIIPGMIVEFPAFSFLLGDLHPHVMSLPFVVLALGAILNVYQSGSRVWHVWLRRHWIHLAGIALLVGAIPFINTWDFPTIVLVLVVALLTKSAVGPRAGFFKALVQVLLVSIPAIVLSLAMYAPFYLTFSSQAVAILPVREGPTRLFYWLLIWSPFMFFGGSFLFIALLQGEWIRRKDVMWPLAISTAATFLPVAVWILLELGMRLLTDQTDGMWLFVGRKMVAVLPLMILISVTIGTAMLWIRKGSGSPISFVLSLLGIAGLLIMGPELFFVLDLFGTRMNTVFKLYYQAWLLLAVVSGYGIYYVCSFWKSENLLRRATIVAWCCLASFLLVAILYYPTAGIASRVADSRFALTLDGLAHVARSQPGEYAAIHWLLKNSHGDAVVLEAVGDDYSEYGRVSSSTGNPTVLGWSGHELQWRGSSNLFSGRAEDVQEIYQTQDLGRARELLKKYNIQYIVVGPREKHQYGGDGLSKFDVVGRLVLSEDGTALYRVAE